MAAAPLVEKRNSSTLFSFWKNPDVECLQVKDESNVIGCHICHLREKLYEAEPDAPFTIRCVGEAGYCFEVDDKTEILENSSLKD